MSFTGVLVFLPHLYNNIFHMHLLGPQCPARSPQSHVAYAVVTGFIPKLRCTVLGKHALILETLYKIRNIYYLCKNFYYDYTLDR